MTKHRIALAILLGIAVSLGVARAQQQHPETQQPPRLSPPPAPSPQTTAQAPVMDAATAIGVDDTLRIQVPQAPELSGDWRVGRSGNVTLPVVGQVPASGLTQEEFELELTKRLTKYVREPHVSIYVSESRSRPVTVAGAVRQPGEHQVASSATLLKVIAQAGGTVDPGPTVVLTRPVEKGAIPHLAAKVDESGKYEYVELDLVEVMDGSSRAANLPVQPYDRITVSTVKVPVPKVYIAGEVVTPGQVELVTQKRVSITRLVAVAGGFSRTAKPSRTLVVHVNAAGERTSTETVNLSKILNGKAEDYQVSAGDMVIVPSSKLKTVIAATSQSLVSGSFIFLGRF